MSGPLVPRRAKDGAYVFLGGVLFWIAVNIAAQVVYPWANYSLSANYISDLGGTHHSADPWVFNIGTTVFGLLIILSALLLPTGFPARRSSRLGLGLLAIAGLGTTGVGIVNEDLNGTIHGIVAFIAFAFSGLSLLVLAWAMRRDTRWGGGYRTLTLLLGAVTLVALALFGAQEYVGLGVGGMERLIVAPTLLWGIVVSSRLLRLPTFAARGLPGTSL